MNEHLKYIKELAKKDGRYSPEAFIFVSEAIVITANWLRKGMLTEDDGHNQRGQGSEFHVSGRELLAGIKRIARERWGCMAKAVFNSWNVYKTDDFGEIVYCMVNDEGMNWQKRDCDSIDDFKNVYEFSNTFEDFS